MDVTAGIRDCLENVGRRESSQAGHACDRMPLLSIGVPIVTAKKGKKCRIVILTQDTFVIRIDNVVI